MTARDRPAVLDFLKNNSFVTLTSVIASTPVEPANGLMTGG